MLGWLVWQFAKQGLRQKARHAAPHVEHGRPNKSAAAAAVASAVAVAFVWHKLRRSGDDEFVPE
jgi:hypothetical protein